MTCKDIKSDVLTKLLHGIKKEGEVTHIFKYLLYNTEQELGGAVFPTDGAEADKAGQKGDNLVAREFGQTDNTVQSEMVFLHNVKQQTDVIIVGNDGTLRLL